MNVENVALPCGEDKPWQSQVGMFNYTFQKDVTIIVIIMANEGYINCKYAHKGAIYIVNA